MEGITGLSRASGTREGAKGVEVDKICEGVVWVARSAGMVRLR